MKIEDLRAMKTDQLESELERLRRHYYDLRAQAVTEKLEDPTQLLKTRRNCARILTVLRNERSQKNTRQRQAHLSALAAKKS